MRSGLEESSPVALDGRSADCNDLRLQALLHCEYGEWSVPSPGNFIAAHNKESLLVAE